MRITKFILLLFIILAITQSSHALTTSKNHTSLMKNMTFNKKLVVLTMNKIKHKKHGKHKCEHHKGQKTCPVKHLENEPCPMKPIECFLYNDKPYAGKLKTSGMSSYYCLAPHINLLSNYNFSFINALLNENMINHSYPPPHPPPQV